MQGRAAALVLGSVLLTGCGDEKKEETSPQAEGPAFAIGATMYNADGSRTSYVAIVPSTDPGTMIDYQDVLELPSAGRIWGTNGQGVFFAADNEAGLITKYALVGGSKLEERGTLSFSAYGITKFSSESGSRIDVVADDKAYFFDAATGQAIVWNPQEMVALDSIDLSDLANPDFPTSFGFSSTMRRGSQLVTFAFYENFKEQAFAPELRVILIDTETDRVRVLKDERCPATYATLTSSGDVYFSSDGRAAAYHHLRPEHSPEPCLLRLRADASELDPDFQVPLSSMTDGKPTGGLVPSVDGKAYVLAFDAEVQSDEGATDAFALYSARAWRWRRVDLASGEPDGADSAALTAGGVVFSVIDEDVYSNDSSADYSSTTVLKTSAAGRPVRGLEVRGIPIRILRLR